MAAPSLKKIAYHTLQQGKTLAGLAHKELSTKLIEAFVPGAAQGNFPINKDLIKKIGVERRVYTAGKNKSTLDPFVDEKEEDIKRLKNIQLELHADFIKVVETSRGSKLKEPEKNNIFTGEFWTGKTSLSLGLIDGIGNADQVLKQKFGDKVIIKNFEKPKGFIARKLSSSIQDPVDKLANILEEKSMWQKFGL